MSIDLSDAYLKLQRACEHIAELDDRIARYLSTDFYEIAVEPEDGTDRFAVVVQSLHEPDRGLNALIGDAVGNLRSVLDYAVVAIVAPITGSTTGIGCPFADDKTGFEGEVTKAWLRHASQPIQDHFINYVQTYKGGKGEAFWAINKLRNIDKHRLLIATVELAGVKFSLKHGGLTISDAKTMAKPGEKTVAVSAPNGAQITDGPTPVFDVRFNEAGVLEHTSVVSFLQYVAKDAKCLLDTLKII